jgi:hypothetical protein
MTLIISCITRDFVMQVSDRRVSVPEMGLIEDRANKALFFCGQSAWAYTGLANIYRKRTDEWLTDRFVKERTLMGATDSILRGLDSALGVMRRPSNLTPDAWGAAKRLAVAGVGFADFRHARQGLAAGYHPYVSWISNFFEPPDRWLGSAAPRFSFSVAQLRPDILAEIAVFGQALPFGEEDQLRRAVHEAVEHSAGPLAVARLLIRAVRSASERNAAVGKNVMCVVLNRTGLRPGNPSIRTSVIPLNPSAPESEYFRRMSDDDDSPLCLYMPADTEARVYFMPVGVCHEMVIAGGAFGPAEEMEEFKSLGPFPPYKLTKLR